MTTGVRYYSSLEASGYGLVAIAYVRALVNAGVAVQWVVTQQRGDTLQPIPAARRNDPALIPFAIDDAALADLPALLRQTAAPIDHDTVIVHCVPEHWQALHEPGKRNLGITTWETDRIPEHWPPLLEAMDGVVLNSTQDHRAFTASGLRVPLHVVPVVRRHAWNEFAAGEVDAARAGFGIPADDFVFYTIGTWQPRKAINDLLRAFALAFEADAGTSLIVKTSINGTGPGPFYREAPSAELAQHELDQLGQELGRELPNVCLLPYDIGGRGIDLLHHLGDCFVSLTHGEGWGMGAFDAATLGTPVIMTGWGGHTDFLGAGWHGAVPYRPVAVPVWPPHRPSYWSSQRWAQADIDAAVQMLRAIRNDATTARAAAQRIQLDLLNRFAEPVVAPLLLAAVHG